MSDKSNNSVDLDINEIMKMIPHRYPFLMIDRVTEIMVGESAVGEKAVTVSEPHFQGHFPQRPIMPGVLIVEAMAQSAAILAIGIVGPRSLFMLTGLDKVRFRRRVIPGDQLRIEVRLLKHHHPLWKMHAEARVDGELAVEAELSAMEVKEKEP